MPDVVACEFMDESALAALRPKYDVLYDSSLVNRPDELLKVAASARALIVRNRTQVRGALLDGATALKVVGRLGVGLDNIDTAACAARGIRVCPASGANDVSVAEYVICAAMALLRGAYSGFADMVNGAWPRDKFTGREISGARMGLIGFGSIARHVATRAAAMGMQVGAYDPHIPATDPVWRQTGVEAQSLDALLAASDVVSLHVPLTDATRHLIGAQTLTRMKPRSALINAARGGVVDEDALVTALRAGRLAGAALDVFETEPLTAASGGRFAGLPNVILTPHIAGVTEESNIRVSHVTVAQVLNVLEGR